jgi:hypothetical protein
MERDAGAILSDYREISESQWLRFSAPERDQLWFYKALVQTVRSATALCACA